MKRRIIYVFILSALFFISGCNYSTSVEAQKPKPDNKIIAVDNDDNSKVKQEIIVSKIGTTLPRVWIGLVFSDDGNINSSNSVWTAGDGTATDIPESEGGIKIGTEYDVDVMNCGGYLGSGKIAFVEEGNFPANWSLRFKQETVAVDGVEKIKQCDADAKDNLVNSEAFVIEPPDEKRRNIKIGKVDTRKLFASLPEETKKLLNNKLNLKAREKNNLSLANNLSIPSDQWTDIDGDGIIDLLDLSINCGEYECGLIMYLIKGKWIKIGEIQPA